MKEDTSLVANELIKRLDTHLNDENIGNPFFPERGVRPFPLTTDGFKVIERVDSHNAAMTCQSSQAILQQALFIYALRNCSVQVERNEV